MMDWRDEFSALEDPLAAMYGEILDLRKCLASSDEDRLNWLDNMDEVKVYNDQGWVALLWRRGYPNSDGETIRSAIDMMMEK